MRMGNNSLAHRDAVALDRAVLGCHCEAASNGFRLLSDAAEELSEASRG
jgi:hypothetical protein